PPRPGRGEGPLGLPKSPWRPSRPSAVPPRPKVAPPLPSQGRAPSPPAALRLLGLVQVVLGDRLLLALLGQNDPGDQVHQRARPGAEDREHRKDKADDVGVDAEVLANPGANPGDHSALTRPVQLLAITHPVHPPDHALPGAAQTAGPPPHTLKSGSARRGKTERTCRCRRVPPPS